MSPLPRNVSPDSREVACLVNGQPLNHIAVLDRGLHYGDGLFETLAVVDQCPLCWDRHLRRLLAGCERLHIQFDDVSPLMAEVHALCEGVDRAVLKVIITSGEGERGYRRSPEAAPTRIVSRRPWPAPPPPDITVRLCDTRLGHHPATAGVKHLNRLEQVLAGSEWNDPDIQEGLMRDIEGNVIEGTMSNIFAVLPDGQLLTPDLTRCGIWGVVRQYILDHCGEIGCRCGVREMSLEDVYTASELFFCNSIAGIMPVARLGEVEFFSHPIADKISAFLIAREVTVSP